MNTVSRNPASNKILPQWRFHNKKFSCEARKIAKLQSSGFFFWNPTSCCMWKPLQTTCVPKKEPYRLFNKWVVEAERLWCLYMANKQNQV